LGGRHPPDSVVDITGIRIGDARPPLLMDDPFVKFDPQRREAALALCQKLANDRQIILFTCHEGYDGFADKVVDMAALE